MSTDVQPPQPNSEERSLPVRNPAQTWRRPTRACDYCGRPIEENEACDYCGRQ